MSAFKRPVGRALLVAAAVLVSVPARAATSRSASAGRSARVGEAAIVDAIWRWHRTPVAMLVETDTKVDLNRFERSVQFFAGLTGVVYEHGSDIGRVPSPELAGTLKKWDAWYRKNRSRLRLNSSECLILQPEKGAAP